jgi:23S rRNA pseudouridine2605 synthase
LGELPAGAVEEVATRTLRDQLGERLIALAGADFSAPAAHASKHSPRTESTPHPAAPRLTPDRVRSRLSPRKRGKVKSH